MSSTKGRTVATKARTMRAASDTVVCAVYARISQDQKHDEHGSANQKPLALALAKRLGWHVPEWAVYVDPDHSASQKKRRPEYERMLADIEAGRIQAIVATFPDRIYRRLDDLERLMDVVERNHVAIRTVHSGELDLSTASGRLMARVLGSVATHEGEVKAERLRIAYAANRKEGKMPGGPRLFGYNQDGTINHDEAKVVREVARRLLAGEKITPIARDLDERGVRGTLGGALQVTALKTLMRNPRLAGHSMHHGQIVGRGRWEPLLDQETWETVTALLAGKARGRQPRVALLPGLLVCGTCGTSMVSAYRYRKTGKQRTYRCPVYPGSGGCGGMTVSAEPVEEIVEHAAYMWLNDERTRRELGKTRKVATSSVASDLTALRARLAETDALLEDPDAGASVASLVKAANGLRARIAEAEKGLAAAVTASQPLPDLGATWPTDLAARRRLVEVVVRRVVMNPGRGGKFDPDRVVVEPVVPVV